MDKQIIERLRTKPTLRQGLAPRETLCSNCPHTFEVVTMSCSYQDIEMMCLSEPHICHRERDGLCRGVTEKLIRNGVAWEVEHG